ncbi:MAG: hypothetical protein IJ204_02205 [Paludibacteraceae bacterium]|nr:hypothetical protein [Paludibacteraceae bacterium]
MLEKLPQEATPRFYPSGCKPAQRLQTEEEQPLRPKCVKRISSSQASCDDAKVAQSIEH